jgi:hypothetical protein
MLALMVAAFACGRTVLRRMEEFSEDLGASARRMLGVPKKVTDTTLYRLLCQQKPGGLRETVTAMVKGLIASKAIQNDLFPVGVMSFDGKSVWTSTRKKVDGARVSHGGPQGTVSGLGAMHAVLTSSMARPCVDQEMMAAKQGEAPAFRKMFPRVCEAFGNNFRIITGDAGLLCRANARQIVALGKYYLLGLKGNQEKLHKLAKRAFSLSPGGLRVLRDPRIRAL